MIHVFYSTSCETNNNTEQKTTELKKVKVQGYDNIITETQTQ